MIRLGGSLYITLYNENNMRGFKRKNEKKIIIIICIASAPGPQIDFYTSLDSGETFVNSQ